MGRKLARTEGSRLLFFNRGLIVACLKLAGTIPVLKEELIRRAMLGPTESSTAFKNDEGIMSDGLFVGLRAETISVITARDTGSNWVRVASGMGVIGAEVVKRWADLRAVILSIKNVRKLSQRVYGGV